MKPRWCSCSLSFRIFTSRHLFFRLKLFLLPPNFFYTRSFFPFSRVLYLYKAPQRKIKIFWAWCECQYWKYFYFNDDHLFILNFLCNEIVPLKMYSIIYSQCSQLRTSIEIEIFYVLDSLSLSFLGSRMKFFVIFSFFCFDGAINIPFECVYTYIYFFLSKDLSPGSFFLYNLIKITVVVDRPFAEQERHLQCFWDFFFHFEMTKAHIRRTLIT